LELFHCSIGTAFGLHGRTFAGKSMAMQIPIPFCLLSLLVFGVALHGGPARNSLKTEARPTHYFPFAVPETNGILLA
jgi:hypothetical protein